jgi:hypothetical protein
MLQQVVDPSWLTKTSQHKPNLHQHYSAVRCAACSDAHTAIERHLRGSTSRADTIAALQSLAHVDGPCLHLLGVHDGCTSVLWISTTARPAHPPVVLLGAGLTSGQGQSHEQTPRCITGAQRSQVPGTSCPTQAGWAQQGQHPGQPRFAQPHVHCRDTLSVLPPDALHVFTSSAPNQVTQGRAPVSFESENRQHNARSTVLTTPLLCRSQAAVPHCHNLPCTVCHVVS